MGFKAPLIPFGISGSPTQGGFRTPLPWWQGGGVDEIVITGDPAVPHATLGLFCDVSNFAAVPHSTFGLFCDVIEVVDFVPKPERLQDFKANQRVQETEETNRDLILEQKNAKLLFNEQSRSTDKTVTNRKITQGGKGKGSKFVNKNRTIH